MINGRRDAVKLTALAVANARPGRTRREIHDRGCPGLYLVVQPSGHRSWACRYRFKGLSRKLTLGPALVGEEIEPASEPQLDTPLSLLSARVLALQALRQARSGVDPAALKRQKREAERAAEADTLQAIAEEFLRREGATMRTLDQRKADLELLYKPLGALPIDQIRRGQFTRVFDHIADTRGLVRADRVLSATKRLLGWHAERSEYISVLGRGGRRTSITERARSRVLNDEELGRVWKAAEPDAGPFGGYVRFVLLTAARRSEAGAMKRGELLDPATWLISGSRYKNGRDTLIPLSAAAQTIVAAQPGRGEYVFSFTGKNPLSNFAKAKRAFDAACGVFDWHIHDLRRTSRTLLSRAGVAPDIAEQCLGHALTGVRGVYDRHSFEAEKRAAFETLAALIGRIVHPSEVAVADLAIERGKRGRQ